MIGYKIRYKDYDYIDYDKVIYFKYENAEEIMEDAKEQFPDKSFSIYEIDIKE